MPFAPRHAALISAVLIFAGTGYSIYYSTWLDTSDPLLTGQPHPLNASHYFASKQNPLNIVFLKRLWFWTTAAFGAMFFTSPPGAQTYERIYKYTAETGLWWIFTSWFFGPALLERVITITGGECSVTLPSGYLVTLPAEYCYPGGPRHISPATHPTLFAASLLVPEMDKWKARPRLRKGHDVSGHIFLLTMSCLFLVDQLLETRRARGIREPLNKYAMYGTALVIAVEFFSMYVTSVYFHSPSEKFTGLLLGFAGYAVTKLPIFFGQTPLEPVPVTKEEVVDAATSLKESIKEKAR